MDFFKVLLGAMFLDENEKKKKLEEENKKLRKKLGLKDETKPGWFGGLVVLVFFVLIVIINLFESDDKTKKQFNSTSQEKIVELIEKVRKIPVSNFKENLIIYYELSELDPENKRYKEKIAFYEAKLIEKWTEEFENSLKEFEEAKKFAKKYKIQ